MGIKNAFPSRYINTKRNKIYKAIAFQNSEIKNASFKWFCPNPIVPSNFSSYVYGKLLSTIVFSGQRTPTPFKWTSFDSHNSTIYVKRQTQSKEEMIQEIAEP